MRLESFKKPVDLVVATICVVVMTSLVVCVVWQVFSRWVLNAPSTFTDEIARFSMIWVGLLGAAYTVGAQRHLAIDLAVAHLTGVKKRICTIYTNLCVLAFAASAMIWGGIHLATRVMQSGQVSPAMQVPMAYVYAVLPLAGIIMCYYSLLFILDAIVHINQPDDDVHEEQA
ncbi:TRAP transporter small permease [Celerinatantimonas sp. MCCC 1A17872]|uniref:TRAP transporter small permease n=1 Tax=Celerinatantimonas sp. MCCC 1A17872 TaxID=3177514 RepID=UPI0038C6E1D1